MIFPVFTKKDFSLCDVKVPNDYPQSQTHAGIAYFQGCYYLTCSPYPAKKYTRLESYWRVFLQKISNGKWGRIIDAEKYENPMLYVGLGNKDAPPTRFEPVCPFPLMETPASVYGMPAYNSDPDLFIEDDKVYILNRSYYRRPSENGADEKEVLISLVRGHISDNGYQMSDIIEFKKSRASLISPCLIKYKGKYLFTSLETNSAIDGHTFDGLYMQQSDTILGLKDGNCKEIVIEGDNMIPWHMSLFTYKERLFSIVTCVERGNTRHLWQMLGEFNEDISVLTIFPKPLTDYNSYRGSAIVLDGEFILYTTTLNDKIRGSKSVDGRDIVMAKTPFGELLKEITKL